VVGFAAAQKVSVSADAPGLHQPRPPAAGAEVTFVIESAIPENVSLTLTATADEGGVAGIAYARAHVGTDRITVYPTSAPYVRAVAVKEWTAGPEEADTHEETERRRAGASSDRVEALLQAVAVALRAESAALTSAVEHRGEGGRARELRLADQLRGLLPSRFGLTRGAILGRSGQISADQDLLVCDLLGRGAFPYPGGHLVVPESVFAAIQVRTNLRAADLAEHATAAAELADFIEGAIGMPWPGFYGVVAHRLEANWHEVLDRYHDHVSAAPHGRRIALLAVLDAGVCFDQKVFDDQGVPAILAQRSQVLGIAFDAVAVSPRSEPFVDFYRLLLRGLQRIQLPSPRVPTVEATDPSTPSIDSSSPFAATGFAAVFAGRSLDLTLRPGQIGTFTLFFANVGTEAWEKATDRQCELVVADPPGHRTPFEWVRDSVPPSRYAAQTQSRIAPGQIGTFTFNVSVPADAAPGNYRFYSRAAVARVGSIVPEVRACVVRVSAIDPARGAAARGAL
jgi:hypothetical protein